MKALIATYYDTLEEAQKKCKENQVIIKFKRKILGKNADGFIVVGEKQLDK